MRKAARAKAIVELAMPVPLDNIDDSAPSHEETFDIGPVSNREGTPEELEPLNEDKLAEIRVFKFTHGLQEVLPWIVFFIVGSIYNADTEGNGHST